MFGAYDLHEDRLRVRLRPRRRGRDNLRTFAANHNIELVATPTYASYLDPVQCHFFPIGELVVNNADYLDWNAFAWALARHVQHLNGLHRAKRIRLLEACNQIAA